MYKNVLQLQCARTIKIGRVSGVSCVRLTASPSFFLPFYLAVMSFSAVGNGFVHF